MYRGKKFIGVLLLLFGLSLGLIASENTSWKTVSLSRVHVVPDSVKASAFEKLNTKISRSDRVFALGCIARSFRWLGQIDSAEIYAQQAENLITQSTPDNYKAIIYEELTNVLFNMRRLDEAYPYAEKMLQAFENSLDQRGIIRAYRLKGLVQNGEGQNDAAMQSFLTMAEKSEAWGHEDYLASAYSNIGNTQSSQALDSLALINFQMALEIFKASGDIRNQQSVLDNMGISYKNLGLLKKALQSYSASLQLADSIGSVGSKASTFLNRGNIYMEQNRYSEAKKDFEQSLGICEDLGIYYGLVLNHVSLSHVENELQRYEQAESHARQAIELIGDNPIPAELAKAFGNLHLALAGQGDYKASLEAHLVMWGIEDSLNSIERHEQILEMSTKYETAQKEKEILTLQHKSLKQDELTKRLFLSGGFIILVLVLLLVIYVQRVRLSRKECIITEQERDAMARELELRNRELAEYVHNMAKMSDLLEKMKTTEGAKDPVGKDKSDLLIKLSEALDPNAGVFNWTEFESRFHALHPQFVQTFVDKYADLTPAQIRLAIFIRMNLPNKEIAYVTNKSVRTIESTRYTLRRKMGLEKYESLSAIIQRL